MRTLVIAEYNEAGLTADFFNVLNAAKTLHDVTDVALFGYQCNRVLDQLSEVNGVSSILLADHHSLQRQASEAIAWAIAQIARNYSHIFCSTSVLGKAVMPRVAAYLNVAHISNVSAIISPDIFQRPMYAGRLQSRLRSHDPVKIITLIASAFSSTVEPIGDTDTTAKVIVLPIEDFPIARQASFVSEQQDTSDRKSLQSAATVVSAGRGLNTPENFAALEVLANKLDAAIGATRAVVDAGWMPHDRQIGQTAKTVAPQLYIALGISGATQHIAGIKDSRIIVAVNKDANAPIFQVADYGLVGDINEVLPALNHLL